MRRRTLIVVLAAVFAGCAGNASKYDRTYVSAQLEERTRLPGDVATEDGISEDEAVAIALWNNPAFQESLATLGFTRAELVQAGLLDNPTFAILFPLGPKQLEFVLKLPLEALWLRAKRVAASERDCERAASLLVQHGLETVYRVRAACADLRLAREEAELAGKLARVRDEIAAFEEARLRAGDASPLELEASRIAALQAAAETGRITREVDKKSEELAALLGLPHDLPRPAFVLPPARFVPLEADRDALVQQALAARPDIRAAEFGIEAAGERAGLARWEFLRTSALLDANGEGKEGFEAGPGLDVVLPVFDWNQGGRSRAAAELEHAALHYAAVRSTVVLEVRRALTAYRQAFEEYTQWRDRLLPSFEAALARADKAFRSGDSSRRPVLEWREKVITAERDTARREAELRKAEAQLERSVGARLDPGHGAAVPEAE